MSDKQGNRVFIADDEPEVVDLVQMVLDMSGHTVSSASDGKQALTGIRSELPDLIMLDVRMPKMSGLQVLEQLQADPSTASIPVIMLSVVTTYPEVRKALQHGAIAMRDASDEGPLGVGAGDGRRPITRESCEPSQEVLHQPLPTCQPMG